MFEIRPISDLRNRFTEISKTVHEKQEPVILTRNGYGDMVVMSYEFFQRMQNGQSPKALPAEHVIDAPADMPDAPAWEPAPAGVHPAQEMVVGFTD